MSQRLVHSAVVAVAILVATVARPSTAVAEDTARVSPPTVLLSGLDTRWFQWMSVDEGTDDTAAFEAVLAAKDELGLLDMPAHAAVLLRQAGRVAEAGDDARATELRERASALSPRAALPHFAEAAAEWDAHPWALRRIGGHVVAGYGRLSESLAGRSALGMLWRELLAWAASLFSMLFGLALLIRHGGRVAHDLRLALFRTLTLGQAGALVVLAAVAPALILWSPFAFALVGVAITAAHQGLRERVVSLLVVATMAAAPTVAAEYASLVAANESGASRMVSAVVAPCDDRCLDLLEVAASRDGDAVAALGRAWVYYKRGTPDYRRRALAMLDAVELEGGAAASGEMLRGNIAYADDDSRAAEAHYLASYDLAVNRTQRAAALFGLYRVHAFETRREAAQEALTGALREDESLVSQLAYYDGRSQNRALAVSPLPASVLADRLLEQTDSARIERASREIVAPWYGSVSPTLTVPLCAAAGLLLFLGWLPTRFKLVSTRCGRCATPVSRLVLQPAYDAHRCVLCFQLEAVRGELDADQVEARRARIARWQEAAPNLTLAANIAAPGLGLVVAGWTLRGSALLLAFTVALAALLVASPAEQLPYSVGGIEVFDGHGVIAAVLLVFAYGLSVGLSRRAARQQKETR